MKYVCLDTETTGLEAGKSQVLSFSAVLENLEKQKPISELPYFDVYIVSEDNIYSGEPIALSMNSGILEKLGDRKKEILSLEQIKELIDKSHQITGFLYRKDFTEAFKHFLTVYYFKNRYFSYINVGGKNAGMFDIPMCRRFFEGFEQEIKVSSRIIDPGILYAEAKDKGLPNLNECLRRAGINREVTHQSLSDCYDVIELVRKKLV